MSALAGIQKEKIRSVIMCTEREFKSKAVLFLNAAAFPAEKTTVDNIEEAVSHFYHPAVQVFLLQSKRDYLAWNKLFRLRAARFWGIDRSFSH